VPFRQTPRSSPSASAPRERSKAFREALLAGRLDDCVEIARQQTRDGRTCSTCVDYVAGTAAPT